uniref:Phosphodiesterase n=1 Tax=Romanomermis culicivorax TaxID=13658 RepID=A0A915KKH8_ROMCU
MNMKSANLLTLYRSAVMKKKIKKDMSILAMNIIKEAKRLVQCEICVLFVIDKENTEMIAYAVENEVLDLPDVVNETRLPQNKGIIGAVANSANLVCLANPMDNPNYDKTIAEEDVLRLSLCNIPRPSALSEEFCKFSFIPRSIPIHDTIVACMSMFDDLGFIQKYRIKRKTLSRFLLLVEKGYRDVPYHNWSHAFAVAHFCYLLLKLLPLNKYLTDLERLSLFVACLCHDIDHRGTTNSFQVQSKTMLAQLYSSEGSVLERHHFAQTMCILNIENCNIFDALTAQEYQRVLDNMRDVILATDIAQHLRLRKGMEQIAADGYKFESKNDHYLISCLMITACDLSDQTKKWSASKHIAGQIYAEFFSQGDLERAMGNTPNLMMDRERACIPKLQIDFLDTIALPCYKLLSKLFADSQTVYATIYHSRRCWVMLHKILRQTHSSHSKCNLDVLHDKDLEDEVLRVVGPVEILSPDEVILTEKEIC